MAATPAPCVAVVLAGGQGARLGAGPKALAPLAGRPMIEHVLQRLEPQVAEVALSVERNGELDSLPGKKLEDRVESHRGPLSGLHAGLHWLARQSAPDWLLLCPCDAPFLPSDLAGRLLAAVRDGDQAVACVRYEERLQPTFSLWRRDRLGVVEEALLARGEGGLMRVLLRQPHVAVDWPTAETPPFFNVNRAEDLAQAERWLDRSRGSAEDAG